MPDFYITFGQNHSHKIDGVTYDRDCVGVIWAENCSQARKIAVENFGYVWCFLYSSIEEVSLELYPRGLIKV